ncbi:hypothetical protein N44_00656 [Microcystis aeruginosa NIES-44]|uniref:Uncharacterized protein n=1 Tax=Microcystis aeruginosa NIES-44 TaxID=449439 RepID=A0A0A1VNP0_MICAE|nr:hypothetical protein N44_00656 [Microcystis aeruginosa NIES-44]
MQVFRGKRAHYSQEFLLEKVGVYQISNADFLNRFLILQNCGF